MARRVGWRLVIAAGLLPGAAPGPAADWEPTAREYRARAEELEAYLQRHVLGVRFPVAVDREAGGFHVRFRRDWTRLPDPDRFVVYQARLTWTAARAAEADPLRRDEYVAWARHGVAYVRDAFWDGARGGFRSSVRLDGRSSVPEPGLKLAYTNAFAVYALAAAHHATGDPEPLELAKSGFRWIEESLREEGSLGYRGAVFEDGRPLPFGLDDVRPPLDALASPAAYRGMNPHIHLLEAFAELLRVWDDPLLRRRTGELLELVRDRFFVEPGCLHQYLLPDGRPVPGPTSFGHNIETAFLLLEAAEALGQAGDPRTARAARMLVDHTLAYGWEPETGRLFDRGWPFEPAFDRSVQWWALYEALNAVLLMHERHGASTPRYWNAFERTWRFTRDTLTDEEHGGVYLGLDEHGTLLTGKSGNWFASYHQARALLLSAARLRHLAAAGPRVADYPPPPPAPSVPGRGLARTRARLAASTSARPETVRVLFYGQSITRQEWWEIVAHRLRRAWPSVRLVIRNHARGGWDASRLRLVLEEDVFRFEPDLVVFHAYGPEPAYEEAIAALRAGTRAEILVHSDHVDWMPGDARPGDLARYRWHERHSVEWLPALAERHGLGLVHVWEPWGEYLRRHGLQAKDLLSDDVHLNDRGNFLLADLVSRHLLPPP